jgi:hypothetical protein
VKQNFPQIISRISIKQSREHNPRYSMTRFLIFSVVVAFLATSVHGQSNDTNDPCGCSCAPLNDQLTKCANSTDTFCGCSAWIDYGPQCAACTGLFKSESPSEDPLTVELIRALCLCPKSCASVAKAVFFQCGISPNNCLCPVLDEDGEKCNKCIKYNDPWAGLIFDQLIANCISAAYNYTTVEGTIVLLYIR